MGTRDDGGKVARVRVASMECPEERTHPEHARGRDGQHCQKRIGEFCLNIRLQAYVIASPFYGRIGGKPGIS